MENFQNEKVITAIVDVKSSLDVLIDFLSNNNEEKAPEGITVLQLSARDVIGTDSEFMGRISPIMDEIKILITQSNLQGALEEARILEGMLNEIESNAVMG